MATQLQLRRGTTVENDGFTGALAEVTVDTDTHELRVHDGSTQGGFVIPTESDMNAALGDKADVSDVYDKATVDTALNAKAETDLSNITDGAKNVASWSSNITNCITEIPQDIKLELNAGTLTLKAGSKVYVPNGIGVFDTETITSDLTLASYAGTYQEGVVWTNSGVIDSVNTNKFFSGSSTPTFTGQGLWYDTANNICKISRDGGSTWEKCSLPLCLCIVDSGTRTQIQQTFNGFGYIGSTVFALPGVKGLIPDGRNADGSLKNTTTNDLTTVKTVQVNTSTAKIAMYSAGGLGSQTKNFGLNEAENYNYDSGVLTNALEVARVIVDSNAQITAFTPKPAFHAVDYSDTEYIAHQAMPSTLNINLTLGASGTEYIAPADGWFVVGKSSGTSGAFFNLVNETAGIGLTSDGYQTGNKLLFVPVSKGNVVKCTYNFSGSTSFFRFIYANGAK